MGNSANDVDDDPASANQVYLRGRLADDPALRELPSGDELVVFRLTVPRADRPGGSRVRVDSLECTSTSARVRRSVVKARVGDQLEVTGSLHRRFWRSPAGPASRYTVDAATVRVTRAIRPGRSAGASTGRKRASA
jgi:single-strand DNA-binding protein